VWPASGRWCLLFQPGAGQPGSARGARELRAAAEGDREAGGRLDSAEAQRKWIDAYLERLWRLRTGFVMLRKDEHAGPYAYADLGIETHLLNEKRFGLAFPVRIEPDGEIDPSQVNSILRPRLPTFDLGDIRNPW